MSKFIRFVIAAKDEDSGQRLGVFQAITELEEAGELHAYEQSRFNELLTWFNDNLREPTRFRRSPNKFHTTSKGISWFKDSANSHLNHMRELCSILEAHNVAVEMIQTERPGYVFYEDEFQIVAEAFRDTGA